MDVLLWHSCGFIKCAISPPPLSRINNVLHCSTPPSKITCRLTTLKSTQLLYVNNCFADGGYAKEEVAVVAVAAAREAIERGVRHRRDWIEIDDLGFRRCEGQWRETRSDSWVYRHRKIESK